MKKGSEVAKMKAVGILTQVLDSLIDDDQLDEVIAVSKARSAVKDYCPNCKKVVKLKTNARRHTSGGVFSDFVVTCPKCKIELN
ncbi:MAG: hypothetical protein HY434_00745 [Candidatus Liptonbacteria bacterium]|nr:hypothetical protein [Parcubacteria group bacterium]MBI4087344.1 hypothetical protein [Candidatus Liptonbacteria bacterium]